MELDWRTLRQSGNSITKQSWRWTPQGHWDRSDWRTCGKEHWRRRRESWNGQGVLHRNGPQEGSRLCDV